MTNRQTSLVLLIVIGFFFISVLTYGHALKGNIEKCTHIELDISQLFCVNDAPIRSFFSSVLWPYYWSGVLFSN